jgi:hypothetical protein
MTQACVLAGKGVATTQFEVDARLGVCPPFFTASKDGAGGGAITALIVTVLLLLMCVVGFTGYKGWTACKRKKEKVVYAENRRKRLNSISGLGGMVRPGGKTSVAGRSNSSTTNTTSNVSDAGEAMPLNNIEESDSDDVGDAFAQLSVLHRNRDHSRRAIALHTC